MRCARLLASLAFGLCVAIASTAGAHGGLPVSQRILRKANNPTLYVPVVFWGVWVGGDGKPWRWICEELMNNNRSRRLALSTDGTFYATDLRGITLSRDEGCTWVPAVGELADRRVTDVDSDPVDGATAYVTTGDALDPTVDAAATADNALWVTHDHGTAFTRVAGLASQHERLFQTVRVAPSDPKVLYVGSVLPGGSFSPTIHRSDDVGVSFNHYPLTYLLDGVQPFAVEILAIDPRDPKVMYLRVFASGATDAGDVGRQALLRTHDGGATFSELLKQDGVYSPSGMARGIDGVAIDLTRGRVLVATAHGLYAGDDAGSAATVTLAHLDALSQAQCVDVHDGTVLACSNNYQPDNAAIARSDDGAQTFQSILRYYDTEGPVDCPKGTPVGDQCPLYWAMYGSQLGIEFGDGGLPVRDAGTDGPPPGGGCGCELGAAPLELGGLVALLVPALALTLRRRRARR